MGAFGEWSKWATQNLQTGNTGKKAFFVNGIDLGRCANVFIRI